MKTIGLIGGMSRESSGHHYRTVNQAVRARLGGAHLARSLMLASAGVRSGFARTWRHRLGIVVGFGIVAPIAAVSAPSTAMKIGSILYVLYPAWRIGTAKPATPDAQAANPMGFVAAAGFQWINPEAWIMTLTCMATYTSPGQNMRLQILLLTLLLAVVGAASSSTWVAFGQLIRRYLTSPGRQVAFAWSMAALLVLSIVPAVFER